MSSNEDDLYEDVGDCRLPLLPSIPFDVYSYTDSILVWQDIGSALSEFQDHEKSISLVVEPDNFEASLGSFTLTGDVVPPSLDTAKRLAERALVALIELNDELSNEV